ncbi:hypothetical protein GGI35DRAFT_442193 [Trichoderma velutinum]
MWLRDALPEAIPTARIMIYGYSSTIANSASIQNLEDLAISFRDSLLPLVRSETPRPIVFFGHSLGGLIVKQALTFLSKSQKETDMKLVQAVYGIVFFGVPNHGMDITSLIAMAGDGPNRFLVESINFHNSQILDILHRDFQLALGKQGESEIVCFYETETSPTAKRDDDGKWNMDGENALLVSKNSATNCRSWEIGTEHICSIARTHSNMVKFGQYDEEYEKVCERIRDLCQRARISPKTRNSNGTRSFQVPFTLQGVPTSEKFIDRPSDRIELEKYLLPQQSLASRRKIFVLQGLGGIGKTQLAVDFARRHKNAFSAVFWLDGRSEDQIKQSLAKCAERIPELHITNGFTSGPIIREDLDAAVANVMKWLAQPDNTQWLLIFDNVDQEYEQGGATGAYDIQQYLPTADHGSVLITTRLLRLTTLGESRLLKKVDSDLSKAILERWYGRELGPSYEGLLTRLDGLPLALAQAGSYLHETGMDVASYIQIYDQQWHQLMDSNNHSRPPLIDYKQGCITTTWTISLRAIETKNINSIYILQLWVFLDNKQFWHGILQAAGDIRAEAQCPTWLLNMGHDKSQFGEAMGLLLRYSMIQTTNGPEGCYTMHSVVHQWMFDLNSKQKAVEFARLAVILIGHLVPSSDQKEYWILQQRLLPHAERCSWWIQEHVLGWNESFAGDHSAFSSMHQLGVLYGHQGKLKEAEEMYTRALKMREQTLGRDHLLTLETGNNLGGVYSNQGRLKEAEEMYNLVLEGMEKVLGRDHVSTLYPVHNLGAVYFDQGKFKEAEEMYNQALEGRERILGYHHPLTLSTVENLGNVYSVQGKLKEAEGMYNRALGGYEKIFGRDHSSTFNVVYNLGGHYYTQGKFKEAEEMYDRALKGREKTLGRDHLSTLRTVDDLGRLYHNQGRLKEAEEMYGRALKGFQSALGPTHPKSYNIIRNLELLQADRANLSSQPQKSELTRSKGISGKHFVKFRNTFSRYIAKSK